MTQTFELVPGQGVAPVALGMARDAVHQAMGTPEASHAREPGSYPTDYWHDSGFQVSYAADGTVEFVELSRGSGFAIAFDGQEIQDLPVADAVRLVSARAACREQDGGATVVFPALALSLWRPFPVDPEEDDDEYGGAFAAFGLGVEGSFDR